MISKIIETRNKKKDLRFMGFLAAEPSDRGDIMRVYPFFLLFCFVFFSSLLQRRRKEKSIPILPSEFFLNLS